MTINEWLANIVGILAPTGGELRLSKDKARGEEWNWSRESGG